MKNIDISNLLTNQQNNELLNKMWLLLNDKQKENLYKVLNKDIADTLKKITSNSTDKIQSKEKVIENWKYFVSKLDNIIYEAGLEDGKYIEQDKHWEPPYLDPYLIAHDIEKNSEIFLNYLKRDLAFLPENKNFFFDYFNELNETINFLPQWFAPMAENIYLGKNSTEVILLWEYLNTKSNNLPIKNFIDRLVDYDKEFENISFDEKTFIDFILSKTDKYGKEIYEAVKNNPYLIKKRDKTYLFWNVLYKNLSNQFDENSFLNFCKDTINSDWKNGIPVIEKLLNEKNYSEGEKFVVKTLSSYLDLSNKNWELKNMLILPCDKYSYNYIEINNNLLTVLQFYKNILEQTKQTELYNAIYFQLNIIKNGYSFKTIKNEYVKNYSDKIFLNLYFQWKEYIIKSTLRHDYNNNNKKSWINYLLETEIENDGDYKNGTTNICNWINSLKNFSLFQEQINILKVLTNDLNKIKNICDAFPCFYNNIIILNISNEKKDQLKFERVECLKNFDIDAIYTAVMQIWILHAKELVPSPKNKYKSDYKIHVQYFKAVMEIAPETAKEILNDWKINHKKRKNLWKEFQLIKIY